MKHLIIMNKHIELKSEYNNLQSFLLAQCPSLDTDTLMTYFTAAALKIWGSNLLYSPDYRDALSAVTGTDYTVEQVMTAMGCCGDPERRLQVPHFYQQLAEKDAKEGASHTAEVLDKLSSLLVAAAMVNGDFTVEEANTLSDILSDLTRYAAEAGVKIPAPPDYQNKITGKNEGSYLQNDELLKTAREVKRRTQEEKAASEGQEINGKPEDPAPSLNITIKLTADDVASAQAPDAQAAQPEEPPAVSQIAPDQAETMESLLAELDSLVGLENVKQDVHSLMNFIKVTKIREKRGMKVPTISYHLVFTGNPGTGKTTVARLVAKLYYHMGIFPQGQLVETDRSALVAGYLGQTAIKTQKVIQQAMGGVLFVDEAYSLAGETDDSYGKEAIETILKAMEDHRDELVVIVAGYTELMHKFIDSNPGLSSRFSKYFEFPDYTGEELLAIFEGFCQKNGYSLEEDARTLLKEQFEVLYEARDEHFGNARAARNIFEKAINAQADRIAGQSDFTDADLENLTAEDISAAVGGEA